MNRKIVVALFGLTILLAACEVGKDKGGKSARDRETDAINSGFDRVTQSQQVPTFDFSQERETLIDILSLRAQGTHGTAVVTTLDGALMWWCPTVGAPIPSTYQLTNPSQIVGGDGANTEEQVIGLGEPTGVYPGDSTATWILCLDDNGKEFAEYEEANVRWTSGVVNGLPEERRAVVDEITFEFSTEN